MTTLPAYTVKELAAPMDNVILTLREILPAANVLFWHDASDDSTLDLADGGVYRRLDKSGNGNHLIQTTIANRPVRTGIYDDYTVNKSMLVPGVATQLTTAPVFYVLLARVGYISSNTPIVGAWASNFGWKMYLGSSVYLQINGQTLNTGVSGSTYDAVYILDLLSTKGRIYARSSYGGADAFQERVTTITPLSGDFVVGGYATGQYMRFYEQFALVGEIPQRVRDLAVSYVCNKWAGLLGVPWYQSSISASNPYRASSPRSDNPASYPAIADGLPNVLGGNLSADLSGIIAQDDIISTFNIVPKSGNVLANDSGLYSLTVSAVNGSGANVGTNVAGSNGGVFNIASTGAYTFDPSGIDEENDIITTVDYYAFDGTYVRPARIYATVKPVPSSWDDDDVWSIADYTGVVATWLDGHDQSKMTFSSNDILTWQDKGYLGYTLASRSGYYPVKYLDATTQRNYARFNANACMWKNSYYQIADLLRGEQSMIFAFVCRNIGNVSEDSYDWRTAFTISTSYYTYNTSANNVIPRLDFMNSTPSYGAPRQGRAITKFDGNSNGYMCNFPDMTDTESAFQVYLMTIEPLVSPAVARMKTYKNGNYNTYTNGPSKIISSAGAGYGAVSLGGQSGYESPNPTIYLPCKLDIAECIVISEVATPDIFDLAQKVEGYLGHKWGAISAYPSNHPYKVLPPFKE